jgi:hypothetical protein
MRFSAVCSSSFAIAAIAIAVYAEEPGESAELSLAELMHRMATTTGVIADFQEQKEITLLEQPLRSSGRLFFVPPDRLARFTLKPEFSALVIDGNRLYFQDGTGEEFDLSGNLMARVFVDNFIVLFNGDLERLQSLYRTDFSTKGGEWSLILTPRRAPLSKFVEEITLRGDSSGMREMVIRNSDGDRTETRLDVVNRDYGFTADTLHKLFVDRALPSLEISR